MSPDIKTKPIKPIAASNVYTVLVIAAFFACAATAVFVALTSYSQFGSLFSMQ